MSWILRGWSSVGRLQPHDRDVSRMGMLSMSLDLVGFAGGYVFRRPLILRIEQTKQTSMHASLLHPLTDSCLYHNAQLAISLSISALQMVLFNSVDQDGRHSKFVSKYFCSASIVSCGIVLLFSLPPQVARVTVQSSSSPSAASPSAS